MINDKKERMINVDMPESMFLYVTSSLVGASYDDYRNSLYEQNPSVNIHKYLMKQYIPQRFKYSIDDEIDTTDGRTAIIKGYCYTYGDAEAYWVTYTNKDIESILATDIKDY